jgi:hypothetical protein
VLAFIRGAFEFVVGDDLPTALGIVLALAATATIATAGLDAWWLMPLAAIVLLRWSLQRRARALVRERPDRESAPAASSTGGAA